MLGTPSEIIENNTQKIVDKKLDIKLGDFSTEELNEVLKKLKGRKLQDLTKYPPMYGRWVSSMTYFLGYAMQYIGKTE